MSDHQLGHPASAEEDKIERRELLASVDRFLVKHYGERCSERNGGCPCCIVWAARDMLATAIVE